MIKEKFSANLSRYTLDSGCPKLYGSRSEAIKMIKNYKDILRTKADALTRSDDRRVMYSALWAIGNYLDEVCVNELDDALDILEGYINELTSAMLRMSSKKMYTNLRYDIDALYDLMDYLSYGITKYV